MFYIKIDGEYLSKVFTITNAQKWIEYLKWSLPNHLYEIVPWFGRE